MREGRTNISTHVSNSLDEGMELEDGVDEESNPSNNYESEEDFTEENNVTENKKICNREQSNNLKNLPRKASSKDFLTNEMEFSVIKSFQDTIVKKRKLADEKLQEKKMTVMNCFVKRWQ